jgi:hypothetical protein
MSIRQPGGRRRDCGPGGSTGGLVEQKIRPFIAAQISLTCDVPKPDPYGTRKRVESADLSV